MKKAILLLTIIFSHHMALASGTTIGNGGNGIVCKNSAGKITSVELLDFFEARMNGLTLKLNSELPKYKDIINENLERWQKIAPKRVALYRKWLDTFVEESMIAPGVEIPAIPDTGSIVIPTGCKLEPIAFQRKSSEIYPGVKRYTINKDLWDLMDNVQKAGLVMHELIYREGIAVGHRNSFPTRYFNGYLATAKPRATTYASIISQLPLAWTELGGMIVPVIYSANGRSTINEDGTLNAYIQDFYSDVITEHFSMIGMDFKYPDHKNYIRLVYDGINFTLGDAYASPWIAESIKVSSKQYHLEPILKEFKGLMSFSILGENTRSKLPLFYFSCDNCWDIKSLNFNEPQKNWLITRNNQKISNISTLKIEHRNEHILGTQLITTTGEKWVWDYEQCDYIKSN